MIYPEFSPRSERSAAKLMRFVDASPCSYHAVSNLKAELVQAGFRELQEKGIRGEVKGTGRTVGWANETWVNLPENE